jgi:hypothetical protein
MMGGGGTEKAPLLRGEERDAKTDHHQGDTKCRTGREGGFEGDNPSCHRDRAKRHQHIDRQRSGVTSSERLEPLGLLRGKLALLYQPGDVENDLDGWHLFPASIPETSRVSSSIPFRMHRNGHQIVKEFEAAAVVAS